MQAYLVVKNGHEGIESLLGLFSTKEEAMTRREDLQTKCLLANAQRTMVEAMSEAEQEIAWETVDFELAFTQPDQICVRELIDDGEKLTAHCVSKCTSYPVMG